MGRKCITFLGYYCISSKIMLKFLEVFLQTLYSSFFYPSLSFFWEKLLFFCVLRVGLGVTGNKSIN